MFSSQRASAKLPTPAASRYAPKIAHALGIVTEIT
jgi:hypothetical protein